jgi:hypothetical protein
VSDGSGRASDGAFLLLRCRLGVRLDDPKQGSAFQDALANEIATAVVDLGARVELLQLAVAIDPRWGGAGPPNRCDS